MCSAMVMEHKVTTNQAETAEPNTKRHPSCRQFTLTADQPNEPDPEAYHNADISRS